MPDMLKITGLSQRVKHELSNGFLFVNRRGIVSKSIPLDAYCPVFITSNLHDPMLAKGVEEGLAFVESLRILANTMTKKFRHMSLTTKRFHIFGKPDYDNMSKLIDFTAIGRNDNNISKLDLQCINKIMIDEEDNVESMAFMPLTIHACNEVFQSLIDRYKNNFYEVIIPSKKNITKKEIHALCRKKAKKLISAIRISAARRDFSSEVIPDAELIDGMKEVKRALSMHSRYVDRYRQYKGKEGIRSTICEAAMDESEDLLYKRFGILNGLLRDRKLSDV